MNRNNNIYIHADYEDRKGLLAKKLALPGDYTLVYAIDEKATDAEFIVRLMNTSGVTIRVNLWMMFSKGIPEEVDTIEPEVTLAPNAVYTTVSNQASRLERLIVRTTGGNCVARVEGIERRKHPGA